MNPYRPAPKDGIPGKEYLFCALVLLIAIVGVWIIVPLFTELTT